MIPLLKKQSMVKKFETNYELYNVIKVIEKFHINN